MSSLDIIHKQRQQIGFRRQFRHSVGLNEIKNILDEIGLLYPYRLNKKHYEFFQSKSWFIGSNGLPVKIINNKNLYKLAPVNILSNYASEWISTSIISNDSSSLFRKLNQDYKYKKDWLNYNIYASGNFNSPRNITFWTDYEFKINNVMSGANKVGKSNDWIINEMVILRILNKNLFKIKSKIFVPTVLDAFDSEIFHPTKDKDIPKSGKTIFLNKIKSLSLGVNEFILDTIPIDIIDIMPVFIKDIDIENNGISSNKNLWILLENYYNNL